MANRKKEVYKPKPMTEGKRNIIQGMLQECDIETADDIQDALKDLLSGTLKEMMDTEMEEHLGYERYERSGELNYRNGTKQKRVRSNTASLRWTCRRTGRVLSSRRYCQSVRKTFQPLTTRSYSCTPWG